MAQIEKKIPKGSWVDQNGKRWTKVLFDVMADGGDRFLRQVSVVLGLHFDFAIGGYVFDKDFGGGNNAGNTQTAPFPGYRQESCVCIYY